MCNEEIIEKNLLNEIISMLGENNKSLDSILYVIIEDTYMEKDTFISLENIKYYPNYGDRSLTEKFNIIGDNWLICKYDYDGLDKLSFINLEKPNKLSKIDTLLNLQRERY